MTGLSCYFAYGSNLSTARLRARIPAARVHCVARLAGYRLAFHKLSHQDGSGKCDAYQTDDAADLLWGVVYHIPSCSWESLDLIEGVGRGYRRETCTVESLEGQGVCVQLYVATLIRAGLRPLGWYRQHVLHGAQEHGFPEPYISAIAAQPVQDDPDVTRHLRELSIYKEPRTPRGMPA